MKITVKSNDYGYGFYGDDKPLFWSKSGDCLIGLLEELINQFRATSVEYIGEIDDDEMEQDFA